MIKCPYCGSGAQVKMTLEDTNRYGHEFTREFHCGCGCYFELTFAMVDIKILGVDKKGE